jgi:hypothetical protein
MILIMKLSLFEYKQFDNDFIPFLSMIDIMMFNSQAEIKEKLNAYTLL